MPRKEILKLYWVETVDHDEDWFVVAPSARDARRYHEQAEGYDHGDATATLVCRLPDKWQGKHITTWPTKGVLEDCGGVRVNYTPDPDPQKTAMREMLGVVTEAWSFNGTIYTPGDIVANVAARSRFKSTKKN